MSECPPPPATAITLDQYVPAVYVSHRLAYFSPALKDLPFTIGALLRTFLALPLNNRQLQDNNRHDEFLDVMFSANTILQEARLFFNKTHRSCYIYDDFHRMTNAPAEVFASNVTQFRYARGRIRPPK